MTKDELIAEAQKLGLTVVAAEQKVAVEVDAKVAEARPIVQGWLRKLRDDGHTLYEEVKTLEEELVAKVEGLFGKKSGDVVINVPVGVVLATAPANAPAETPAVVTTPPTPTA